MLNLGGGFGIAYTSADDPTPIEELAEGIVDVVAAECAVRGIPVPALAFEPGRIIVGPAGITLYEVGTVKPVEVGTGDAARLRQRRRRHERQRPPRPVRRGLLRPPRLAHVGRRRPRSRGSSAATASRATSSSTPSTSRATSTPGDLLAVPATGAYCYSLASNYNYVPRPPVIAIRDGEARVIVRGESVDDLLARDVGAASPDESTTEGAGCLY